MRWSDTIRTVPPLAYLPTVPSCIPVPERFVLFAPHPDDIAVSMGALAACIARLGIPTTIVLVTDGSEARLPDNVIRHAGGDPSLPPTELTKLRGRIRISEAEEETARLGFPKSSARILRRQSWFTGHRTPAEHLNCDLSLRNVDGFRPGEIDQAAINEIRDAIGRGTGAICAVPDRHDRLVIHRITHEIVNRSRGLARMLTYECLSTVKPTGPQTVFAFGEDLMRLKCHAIRAHRSMRERRELFGGYSNSGTEFYDCLIQRRNAELASTLSLSLPYAECFGWT